MKSLKMVRSVMLFVLTLAALNAQSYYQRGTPYSFRVWNLETFQTRLKNERGGAVVVLSKDIAEANAKLLLIMSDDKLLPYSLCALSEPPSSEIGKSICEQKGWADEETRWAFVDFRGDITATGAGLPSGEDILKAIDEANIRPRLEVLRQLISLQPELLEAQIELLYELRKIGDIRTFRSIGLKLPELPKYDIELEFEGIRYSGNNYLADLPEHDSLSLEDSGDDEIWGEYIRLFNGLMPKLLPFQSSLKFPLETFVPASLPFSANLKRSANSFSPHVEAALQAEPSNSTLWKLWAALMPDRSIADFLETLTPGPFTSKNAWPPPAAKTAYIAYCRNKKDWRKIIEMIEPVWKALIERLSGERRFAYTHSFVAGAWGDLMEPLLESLLAVGRIADAEQIIKVWQQNSGWGGAFARAATIAKRHGYGDLAKTWGEII
jgi:hypothetical protein